MYNVCIWPHVKHILICWNVNNNIVITYNWSLKKRYCMQSVIYLKYCTTSYQLLCGNSMTINVDTYRFIYLAIGEQQWEIISTLISVEHHCEIWSLKEVAVVTQLANYLYFSDFTLTGIILIIPLWCHWCVISKQCNVWSETVIMSSTVTMFGPNIHNDQS